MITTHNDLHSGPLFTSAWGNFNASSLSPIFLLGGPPLETLAIENKTWDSLTGEFTFTFEGNLEACTLTSDAHGVLTATIDGKTATFDFSSYGNEGTTFESDFKLEAQPLDSQFGNTVTSLNFVITSGEEVYADEGRESTSSEILIKLNADGVTQRIHGDERPEDIAFADYLKADNYYTPTVTEQQQRTYESNGHVGIDLYISPTPGSDITHSETGLYKDWDNPDKPWARFNDPEGSWDLWDDQVEGYDNALNPIMDLRTYLSAFTFFVGFDDDDSASTDLYLDGVRLANEYSIFHEDVYSVILPDGDQDVSSWATWAKPTAVFGEGDVTYYGYGGPDTVVLTDWSSEVDIQAFSCGSQERGLDTVTFNFEGRSFTSEELLESLNSVDVLDFGNGELVPLIPEATVNGNFTLNLDVGDAGLFTQENDHLDGISGTGTLIIKGDSGDTVNFSGGPLLEMESAVEGYDRYVEVEKIRQGKYNISDNEYYIDSAIILNSEGNIHDPVSSSAINFTGTHLLDLSFPLVADAF